MVRLARSEVFDPDEISIAHVCNRTVRRCFLMGDDPVSGKNFDHCKVWIEQYLVLEPAKCVIGIGHPNRDQGFLSNTSLGPKGSAKVQFPYPVIHQISCIWTRPQHEQGRHVLPLATPRDF